MFFEGEAAFCDGAVECVHGDAECFVLVFDGHDVLADAYYGVKLFAYFTGECLFTYFTLFNFSAGEFPLVICFGWIFAWLGAGAFGGKGSI